MDGIEGVYEKNGATFPNLDAPYTPSPLEHDPQVMGLTAVLLGAAFQLMMTVGTPIENITTTYTCQMYMTASLRYVVETSIADVLKEGDPKGVHVDEIAQKINAKDPALIARVLRYMASRHCFREVSPNVFAHNKLSSVLVKTKSFAEIQADPLSQYDGMTASAVVGHTSDEGFKSASHLSEWLQDPTSAPHAFGAAFGVPDMWQWFEQPGNELRRRRFATVMKAIGAGGYPDRIFTEAIDWKALPESATVVDVGGNTGSVSLAIAKAHPHLNLVVQDLPQVIDSLTKPFWSENSPEYVSNGKIKFQPHDFFTPNPTKNVDVFFMRMILHDWSKEKSVEILTHLRAAAQPSTKLVVFDHIILHACPDPLMPPENVPNAPWPMLANLGYGIGGITTVFDIHMLNLFGGQERTVAEFTELGKLTGWKLEKAIPGPTGTIVYSAV